MTLLTMVLIIGLVVIFFLAFLIFRTAVSHRKNLRKLRTTNHRLEIIEAMSYLLSSKNGSVDHDFFQVAKIFFKQKTFSALRVVLTTDSPVKSGRVFSCQLEKKIQSAKNPSRFDELLLTAVKKEKFDKNQVVYLKGLPTNKGANQWPTVVAGRLVYQGEELGYLFFLSRKKLRVSPNQKTFLASITGLLTYILRKNQVDLSMSYKDQLRAVKAGW